MSDLAQISRMTADPQLAHVLLSKVLAMDETPIKASRDHKGKMTNSSGMNLNSFSWPEGRVSG